jgi:hypothetical protein
MEKILNEKVPSLAFSPFALFLLRLLREEEI